MEIGIGKALQYSGLGIGIVFAMIIVLMIVVAIMSRIIRAATAKSAAKAGASATEPTAAAEAASKMIGTPAPGSAGGVKLYNVSDRDAAMIMAIVADRLQTPLNELRFLSIREITDQEA